MNQILSVVFYVSLIGGTIVLWRFTKPISLGKRCSIFGCFAWMIFLFSIENFHDYYVRFYWMYNARNFVREVAEENKLFGETPAEREEIIGLAFAEPSRLAESADNVQRALVKMRSRSGMQTNKPTSDAVSQ